MERIAHEVNATSSETTSEEGEEIPAKFDINAAKQMIAVAAIKGDKDAMRWIEQQGVFWGRLIGTIEAEFSRRKMEHMSGDAKKLVRPALLNAFGSENEGWHSFRDEKGKLRVKKGPPEDGA